MPASRGMRPRVSGPPCDSAHFGSQGGSWTGVLSCARRASPHLGALLQASAPLPKRCVGEGAAHSKHSHTARHTRAPKGRPRRASACSEHPGPSTPRSRHRPHPPASSLPRRPRPQSLQARQRRLSNHGFIIKERTRAPQHTPASPSPRLPRPGSWRARRRAA